MSTPPKPDKRKTVRYTRRIPVRFGNEGKMIGGIALDISEGGLRVETNESFPANSLVTVFVQFPGHALRLEGRIAWVRQHEAQLGIAFFSKSLPLKKSYEAWLKEVEELAAEEGGEPPVEGPGAAADRSPQAPEPATQPPERTAPAPKRAAPPTSPIQRRFETASGQAYDVLIEQIAESWYLVIHQVPRQPGVDAPDLEKVFTDYEAASRALREFIRSH